MIDARETSPERASDQAPPGAKQGSTRGTPWRERALTAALLAAILVAGGWLRFTGADWDSGQHLHPDERFLTMVGSSLSLPQDFLGYLDTDTSTLNPRNTGHPFFSYGTWPVTLTYLTADALERLRTAPDGSIIEHGWRNALLPDVPGLRSYSGIYRVGRGLNALLDLITVVLVFGIAALLYDRRIALLAAALQAFTAFHIQQAHFYTVDAPLTTFVMLTLFGLTLALRRRGRLGWLGLLIGAVGLGMALASKVSVWLLVPVAVAVLGWAAYRERGGAPRWWLRPLAQVALLGVVSFGVLKVAEPTLFAGPGWPNVVANPARLMEVTSGEWNAPHWWMTLRDLMPDALEMYLLPDPRWANSMDKIKGMVTGFGMDWAPNHQWWGRKAYLFPIGNMVRWGMGWPLGLAALAGWLAAGIALLRRDERHALLWLWVTALVGFQGLQWIKTLRYFLPVFAPLTILAAWWLVSLVDGAAAGRGPRWPASLAARWPRPGLPSLPTPRPEPMRRAALALAALVVAGTMVWGVAFHGIYRQDHPRVAASEWIYHNLPTAFGLRLTAIDDALADDIRGPWLPALPSSEVRFDGLTWTIDEDAIWRGPMRVLVPGPPVAEGADAPTVTADAVRVAYVDDPAHDPGAESLAFVVTTKPFLDDAGQPDGVVAAGEGDVAPEASHHAIVAFQEPVDLATGGEYYLWLRATGAPISGRPAILTHETPWDDMIPLGLAGYGGRDDPGTDWQEGLFGIQNFEMYGEDFPGWLDEVVDGLANTDYWISTSNRVYGAVAQLPMRYPATLGFYNDVLFGEGFGFTHTKSVHSYPHIGPWEVPDQAAEEAFHVYDHPKVDIFAVPESRDFTALRAHLEALRATRTWTRFPPLGATGAQRLFDALLGRIPFDRTETPVQPSLAPGEDPRDALDPIDLDPALAAAQRAGGTWTTRFDDDGALARFPLLAALVWYVALALLGGLAFPLVGALLPNLADRGWSVARIAGLLVVAWLGWLISSLRWAPHVPLLLLGCVGALAALSALAAWATRFDALGWVRANLRRVAWLELVMLGLYVTFLAIKASNPDLWHSNFGGEKPMDLAYLQAVLRSTYFPPYDPWFAGGRMNYYYFGFVVFGTLMELTRIVPWVAYNLAVASIAALTGTAAFGLVVDWLTASGHGPRAERAGLVAAFMAVLSGNLFQVPFIAGRLAEVAPTALHSHLPGVAFLSRVVAGAGAVLGGKAALPVLYEHHWYWNASRAIPSVPGDTQPITEFPFFTFLYGDLHAHMMAMPIAMLAFAVALAWALPAEAERRGWRAALAHGAGLTALGALAIGALWPTNAWDYPSFGLVAAGAIVLAAWRGATQPHGDADEATMADADDTDDASAPAALGPVGVDAAPDDPADDLRVAADDAAARPIDGAPGEAPGAPDDERPAVRALRVLLPAAGWGLALLGLSLLLFQPFHDTYVAPYGDFQAWRGYRTPPGAYLVIHGLMLLPIVTWAVLRLARYAAARRDWRAVAAQLVPFAGLAFVLAVAGALWAQSIGTNGEFPAPGWGTPALVGGLIGLGAALLLLPDASWPDRLAGGLLLLGASLTGLVENVVLAGDIGRMNTVFKFYIHVWLIWSLTAGYAVGRVLDAFRGRHGLLVRAWRVAFGLCLATGLLYTVTATRARAGDRFTDADGGAPPPGLDGSTFLARGVYFDEVPLRLAYDAEAFRWLRDNVQGTPTLIEAFRPHYRWGARYSIWTGLPTVIGWDWHQKQQRNGGQNWLVDERARDVETFYNTTDEPVAMAILDQYDVEIIVVGELERALYDPQGLAKIERWADDGWLDRVFQNDGVTLYRLAEGGAAPDDLGVVLPGGGD